ncbi:MAG TPA: DUF1684 domain-containing protein [Thermoanaerobaculaceae bacterium]|nr:DUF1684 domain-containing protein [Thermoanaerobaculaceae bacterium]
MMEWLRRPHVRRLVLLAVAAMVVHLALPACRRSTTTLDPVYLADLEKWRAERLASLTSEYGWLSVVGLFWLQPGANRFGSDPGNEVVLPGASTPAVAGALKLRPDGTVVLHPGPGAGVTLGGSPATERVLASDRTGTPDLLGIGAVRFYLIERGGKLAVRVKDPKSARRVRFAGIRSFPVDPAFRVEGTFEPYPVPREVAVATVQGPEQRMLAPGLVGFRLGGTTLALEPFVSSPGDTNFFFVLRDATSGRETYGAGRFLDTPAPKAPATTVVLDFNRAYTPPCAFTPYATCPLPPKQNELPVRVVAGEKFSAGH